MEVRLAQTNKYMPWDVVQIRTQPSNPNNDEICIFRYKMKNSLNKKKMLTIVCSFLFLVVYVSFWFVICNSNKRWLVVKPSYTWAMVIHHFDCISIDAFGVHFWFYFLVVFCLDFYFYRKTLVIVIVNNGFYAVLCFFENRKKNRFQKNLITFCLHLRKYA